MENENERKWNISVLQPQETTEDYKDSSAGYTEPLHRGNLLKVSTFDSNQPESQIQEYTELGRSNTNESLMRQDSLETQLAYQSWINSRFSEPLNLETGHIEPIEVKPKPKSKVKKQKNKTRNVNISKGIKSLQRNNSKDRFVTMMQTIKNMV